MPRTIRLTLIGKPGCHLCDDAREVVERVRAEVAALPGGPETTLEERSILDDEELRAKHAEEIPVLLVDGELHTYWRVDPERLRAALLG